MAVELSVENSLEDCPEGFLHQEDFPESAFQVPEDSLEDEPLAD